MCRPFIAILLALCFALQPLWVMKGTASCDCCPESMPVTDSESEPDSESSDCCRAAPAESDRGLPTDKPSNHDHKSRCPLSCCPALVLTGFLASADFLALPTDPTIHGLEPVSSHAGPARSALKRPPRAVTFA